MKANKISVYLVGGSSSNEGNVYAYNPAYDVDGPVCDDFWGYEEVTVFYLSKIAHESLRLDVFIMDQ